LKVEPLSVTYARALVELASEANHLRPVLEEVRFFGGLLRQERSLRTFIEIPSISSRAKRDVLERTFRGKIDDLVLDFVELVVQKNRQFLLLEIFAEVEVLYDQAVGRVHVEATSAVDMPDPLAAELTGILTKKLQKTVVLVNRVRPEILGGLVIRYGDLVADNSIRTALEKISNNMYSHKPGSELVHENQSR
jgi:F-type H+-transporting ATPase subunit delta